MVLNVYSKRTAMARTMRNNLNLYIFNQYECTRTDIAESKNKSEIWLKSFLPTCFIEPSINVLVHTYNRIYKKKFRGNMSIHLRIYILENWILNFLILLYISVSATASVPVAVQAIIHIYILLMFTAVSVCATSHLYSEDLRTKWLSQFVCGCITIHYWWLLLCSFLLNTYTQYINERIGFVYKLLDIRWEESTWTGIHSWMYLYAHLEHTYMIW